MIHNMEEERKKRHREKTPLPVSLTDEELLGLIGQVEENALIHAPKRLKNDVFARIQTEKLRAKKRALFSYRAKVLAGMAAALAVLILVPVDGVKLPDVPGAGMVQEEKEAFYDEWEQDILEREKDMEKTWERYREGQERAEARRRYLRKVTEKLKNQTDWED